MTLEDALAFTAKEARARFASMNLDPDTMMREPLGYEFAERDGQPILTPTDKLREWAATQPQDNYVYAMRCGHEIDSPEPLQAGSEAYCSAHGPTRIA